MNKLKLILAGLMVTAPLAFASPGDDGCVGNCGGGGSDGGSQSQLQGQLQGQAQQQGQRQSAESNAIGVGIGYGEGGSARQSQNQTSRSSSSARATGGNAGAISGGNSQDIEVDARDTTVDNSSYSYSYKNDYNAATAASVYGDVCTGGMSGQVEEGGFAVTNPNAFCNYMAAAMIYRDAFEWEMTYNVSEDCMDPMSGVGFETDEEYYDYCANPKAKELLENYYSNLENANEYMEWVEIPAKVDGIFGYLVRPIGVIAVLILLL